jgi:hypothetical protein
VLTVKGVDSTPFNRILGTWIDEIRTSLAADWEIITAEILFDVVSRAPDPSTEYEYIMWGEEGPIGPNVSSFRQSDLERIRFIREPGMWLQQAVVAPGTWQSDAGNLTFDAGNVEMLSQLTRFSWQNYSSRLGPMVHTSEYGVFNLFEYGSGLFGGSSEISPRFGDNYYLSPDVNVRVRLMRKTYPSLNMFTAYDTGKFDEVIMNRIGQVQF